MSDLLRFMRNDLQWWAKVKGALHRVKYPFRLDWLPGQDSNLRPAGYKCPDFSTGLGLSLHPPAGKAREGVGR